MSRFPRSLIGPAVFIVGCATGGAASHYVGTAAAAAPAGVTRWSYACFKDDNVGNIQERANQAGQAGWELVASSLAGGHDMSSPIWCFKRPL